MSHEIRTPMNAVLGYAQLLRRDTAIGPAQIESLDVILSSGRHLLDLIDNILDLSKIEAGHAQIQESEFNLPTLLDECAGMFRHRCEQKGLALRLDVADARKPINHCVRGDERKLRQVLINLLGNAVKFTDAGEITLSVKSQGDRRFMFDVRDTGIGISPAALSSIFEPFHQADNAVRRGGTGLGLAISRRHVEIIGGHLGCRSAVGEGTSFHFEIELPIADVMQAAAESKPSMTTDALSSLQMTDINAVVVDDVAENREVLARMLRSMGCHVTVFETGASAIAHCESNPPAIAFIDILMPQMDGLTVATEIASRLGTSVKLVATSASVLEHEQRQYQSAGFQEVLNKPLQFERVAAVLFKLLEISPEPVAAPASIKSEAVEVMPSIGLPPDMRKRLVEAAAIHSVTELKQIASDIEALGPEAGSVSTFIRACIRRYDLESVAAFVERLESKLEPTQSAAVK